MSCLLLYVILAIHILLMLFILLVPFFGSNYLLTMHFIIVPFIILHWVVNNNTCALTIMEHKIRETMTGTVCDVNDCITYRIISPVYDFNKNYNNFSSIIYIVTISLWLITAYRLYRKYKSGEIRSIVDVCR